MTISVWDTEKNICISPWTQPFTRRCPRELKCVHVREGTLPLHWPAPCTFSCYGRTKICAIRGIFHPNTSTLPHHMPSTEEKETGTVATAWPLNVDDKNKPQKAQPDQTKTRPSECERQVLAQRLLGIASALSMPLQERRTTAEK